VPPKLKITVKKCNLLIRTIDGKHEICGAEYVKERCHGPDSDGFHLNPFKSGFCGNGWCEGIKAKDWRGNPAPTCKFWETCPCNCHDAVSMMFDMAGMERILMENSGYKVDRSQFWMPTDEDRAQWAAERSARSSGPGTSEPAVLESPAPGLVPASITRTFAPTPTGRAARGELETWVNTVCGIWLVEKYKWPCTPLYISETIAKDEGIKPPSTGAIAAVFTKWSDLGFADIQRKPLRFVSYTEAGLRLGLEGMKAEARRKQAVNRSLQERGVRS
jgi:hypothetical protein